MLSGIQIFPCIGSDFVFRFELHVHSETKNPTCVKGKKIIPGISTNTEYYSDILE